MKTQGPNQGLAKITLQGRVQGVGLRPAVARFAVRHGLNGFVRNTGDRVDVVIREPQDWHLFGRCFEASSLASRWRALADALIAALPAEARVSHSQVELGSLSGPGSFDASVGLALPAKGFEIATSESSSHGSDWPRDTVTCQACLAEFWDPRSRRYLYPFITCAACGPRYSLMSVLPFDRTRTTMTAFTICGPCTHEYSDPADRRCHAQTLSCSECGPRLFFAFATERRRNPMEQEPSSNPETTLWERFGLSKIRGEASRDSGLGLLECLERVSATLDHGGLLLMKGLGGYQLLASARSHSALLQLRALKGRPKKPFVVMVRDLAAAHELCVLGPAEREALTSEAGPIVIAALRRSTEVDAPILSLSPAVTSGLQTLGLMLPPSAVHDALCAVHGKALVVTSANPPGEPMVTDDETALLVYADRVDAILTHDRRIKNRVDDSVVRIIGGEQTVFRLGRGLAPLSLPFSRATRPVVGRGSLLKNALARGTEGSVVLGPHIGDLQIEKTRDAHQDAARESQRLIASPNEGVAVPNCGGLAPEIFDLHPSTLEDHTGLQGHVAQHHLSHALSCALDSGFSGRGLAAVWDGFGWGADASAWGGEFFRLDGERALVERVASLRTFGLLGGDKAMREPRRSALAILHAVAPETVQDWLESALDSHGTTLFSESEVEVLRPILSQTDFGLPCSSVGRLIDACACLLGLTPVSSYEAQAAMQLEDLCDPGLPFRPYRIQWSRVGFPSFQRWAGPSDTSLRDPRTLGSRASLGNKADGGLLYRFDWRPLFADLLADRRRGASAAEAATRFHHSLAEMALSLALLLNERHLLISGGVFQNRFLVECLLEEAKRRGLEVSRHKHLPPNDGGLAVGQCVAWLMGHTGESTGRDTWHDTGVGGREHDLMQQEGTA